MKFGFDHMTWIEMSPYYHSLGTFLQWTGVAELLKKSNPKTLPNRPKTLDDLVLALNWTEQMSPSTFLPSIAFPNCQIWNLSIPSSAKIPLFQCTGEWDSLSTWLLEAQMQKAMLHNHSQLGIIVHPKRVWIFCQELNRDAKIMSGEVIELENDPVLASKVFQLLHWDNLEDFYQILKMDAAKSTKKIRKWMNELEQALSILLVPFNQKYEDPEHIPLSKIYQDLVDFLLAWIVVNVHQKRHKKNPPIRYRNLQSTFLEYLALFQSPFFDEDQHPFWKDLWTNNGLSEEQITLLEDLIHPSDFVDADLILEDVGALIEFFLQLTLGIEKEGDTQCIAVQKVNQRKATGTHYTPRELSRFTVDKVLEESGQHIESLRICDPSMGSGAFLLMMHRILTEQLLENCHQSQQSYPKDVVSQAKSKAMSCLFGVDINTRAIEMAKVLFLLECPNLDRSLLDAHFQEGHALVGLSPEQCIEILAELHVDPSSLQQLKNDRYLKLCDILIAHLQYSWHMGKKAAKMWNRDVQSHLQQWLRSNQESDFLTQLLRQLECKPFHWHLAFSANSSRFDIMIGNPPYIDCVRGNLSDFTKYFLKRFYPMIQGSADLSYYFLEKASQLLKDDGVMGLVLPRVSMGAKSLKTFRAHPNRPKPRWMYSANHHNFFEGAAIKVVVYVLVQSVPEQPQDQILWISQDDSPTNAQWIETSLQPLHQWKAFADNWWTLFSVASTQSSFPVCQDCIALKQAGFTVFGGLTTGEFYEIHVHDDPDGKGLKLLTSGGIDPNQSYWGESEQLQKFRSNNFQYPRIEQREYKKGLLNKLQRSLRPKIILANLTTKVEGYMDMDGEYQAATGTQSIYHREDNIEKLRQLLDILHSDYGNQLFHHILGYNAMHSNISLEKHFLEHFPLPKSLASSD